MIYVLYLFIGGSSVSVTQWPTLKSCEYMVTQFKSESVVARCIEVPK